MGSEWGGERKIVNEKKWVDRRWRQLHVVRSGRVPPVIPSGVILPPKLVNPDFAVNSQLRVFLNL